MNEEQKVSDVVRDIFTDIIDDPATAMRTDLDRDALWELADDIKKNGLINPITVRPVTKKIECDHLTHAPNECSGVSRVDVRYEVVAGHRRLSACKIAGMIRVPCVVRDLDDDAAFSVMASENLVREDVDPVDEAVFVGRLIEKHDGDKSAVAKLVRRSDQWVTDRLIVARMPEYMQDALRAKAVKLGVALALFEVDDDAMRRYWLGMAIRDGISVTMAKYWVDGYKIERTAGTPPSSDPRDGAPASTPSVQMFVDGLDGQSYPAGEMSIVWVHKSNMQYIDAIRGELKLVPPI